MHKLTICAALVVAVTLALPAGATLTSTCSSSTLTGNGATKAFTFPCKFLSNSHISVTVAGVTKTQGSDYTVSGAGNTTGTITFVTAPTNGAAIVITRTVPYTQIHSIRGNRTYDPGTLEDMADQNTMAAQQLQNLYTNPPASVLPANVTAKLNDIYFADQFNNIQAAITAAGTTGAVIIPSSYVPGDSYTNPNGIDILDLRIGKGVTLPYVPPGAGGATRSVQTKLSEVVVSIKDYGGVDDGGATNNATALQRAHDALPGNGGTIVFPRSGTTYGIASTVAFTKPVRLLGENWSTSVILVTTNALTVITTTNQIIVEHMGFTAVGAALNTAVFVKQLSASSGHNGTTFRSSYLQGANKAYWAQRATEFHFDGNKCNNGAYCLYLENTTSSDEGDSFVANNEFSNSTSGIFVVSTSGLYISNNKFNGAATCHIDIAPTGAVGDFTIVGNSIEGQTTCGVRLLGGFTNTKVVITGNQFSSGGATHIIVGNNAQNVAITGNSFNDSSAAAGIGIDLRAGAKNVTITGNAFHQILTAMQATTTVLGVDVSGNRFAADVTNYWSGEDSINGQSAFGSSKTFAASREIVNASDVTYVDAFKVKGDCVVDIEISGVVQGVGNSYKYRKILVTNGSTITDAIALITVGSAFDLQVAAAGGYAVISVKRTAATGTTISMMVTVRVSGYPTGFLKV